MRSDNTGTFKGLREHPSGVHLFIQNPPNKRLVLHLCLCRRCSRGCSAWCPCGLRNCLWWSQKQWMKMSLQPSCARQKSGRWTWFSYLISEQSKRGWRGGVKIRSNVSQLLSIAMLPPVKKVFEMCFFTLLPQNRDTSNFLQWEERPHSYSLHPVL